MKEEELREFIRLSKIKSNELSYLQLREYHYLSSLFVDTENLENLLKVLESENKTKRMF